MKRTKHNGTGGFSLIEAAAAIALLGLAAAPVCAGLLLSLRLSVRSEELMQAQLAVTSAVETLMAEGIDAENGNYRDPAAFPDVVITVDENAVEKGEACAYPVTVSSGPVTVETYIRPARAGADAGETGG